MSLHPKKIDMSLDRIRSILDKLGSPHRSINNCIAFVATNSKFSVLRFLQEILRYNNKSTSAHISPHLIRYNERFEYQDNQVSNEKFYKSLKKIRRLIGSDNITFFEALSACFFDMLSSVESDYTLIEAGLGARLDCSVGNIDPLISVIGPISYDHMDFLSDKIELIAYEKSAIIKRNKFAIIGYQPYPEALQILLDQAEFKEAKTFTYGIDWIIQERNNYYIYTDETKSFEFPRFKKHGGFQMYNLGLAIASASKLNDIKIDDFLKKEKYQDVIIPGRFQKLENTKLNEISNNKLEIILDGGHNPGASVALNETIKKMPKKDLCIVLGMQQQKDPIAFINNIENISCIKTVNIPEEANSYDANVLKEKLLGFNYNVKNSTSVEKAISDINDEYPEARVLIVGSLYLAGKVIELFS